MIVYIFFLLLKTLFLTFFKINIAYQTTPLLDVLRLRFVSLAPYDP